jgi:hypothetical protein
MDRQMHEQEQERDARLLDKLDKSIKYAAR